MAVEQDDFSDPAVDQRFHHVLDNQIQGGRANIDRQAEIREGWFRFRKESLAAM